MKSLLLVLFVSTFFLGVIQSSYARSCFVVGNHVFDKNGKFGKILKIKNENVTYSYGHNEYTKNKTKLTCEVPSLNQFKKDRAVVNRNGNIGIIFKVFENSTIVYRIGDSVLWDKAKNLSYQIDKLEDYKRGVWLITNNNYIGTVHRMFSNKLIEYQIDSKIYSRYSKQLSPQVTNIGNYSKGTVVIDKDNDVGVIKMVFKNQKVKFQIGSRVHNSHLSRLFYRVPNIGAYKVGSNVIDSGNNVGVIKHLFSDNRIKYQVGTRLHTGTTKSLSHQVPKIGGFKIGATVIDRDNDVGTIRMVFKSGKIKYKVGSSLHTSVTSRLSYIVDSIGEIKPGATVITSSNSILKVFRVFHNKKVQYKSGSSIYTTSTKTLFHSVTSIKNFKKGAVILDGYNRVGKVLLMFSNNVIYYDVKNDDKYLKHSNELAYEVSKIGRLAKGSVILTNNNYSGKVEHLFSNNKIVFKGNGSRYVTSASKLMKEVGRVGVYKKGVFVIDREGNVGVIETIYTNNTVVFRNGAKFYRATISKLAYEVSNIGHFKTGVIVLNSRGKVGVIEKLFVNDVVIYNINGKTHRATADTLSYEVLIIAPLKKGMVVIDKKGHVGAIQKMFSNDLVYYTYDGKSWRTHYSKLSGEVPQVGPYKNGVVVINNNGNVGTVDKVFRNGLVVYKSAKNSWFSHHTTLAYEVPAIKQYKKGLLVIDRSLRYGTADKVFSNGQVVFVTGRGTRSANHKNLAYEVPALGPYKNGVVVIDNSNVINSVKHTFSNNLVAYGNHVTHTKNLSHEVPTPEAFKDRLVATEKYSAGTILRSFANGKRLFQSIDKKRFVQKAVKLFSELEEYRVDSMLTYKKDNNIKDSNGRTAVLLNVFENGAATYKFVVRKKAHYATAKLFGAMYTEEEYNTDLKNWILRIAKQKGSYANPSYDLVVSKKSFNNALWLLNDYLLENPGFLSGKYRKHVIAYIMAKASDPSTVPGSQGLGDRIIYKKCSSILSFKRTCKLKDVSRFNFIKEVKLLRQLSKKKCILGKTFGFKNIGGVIPTASGLKLEGKHKRLIWVKKGCRGKFEVIVDTKINSYEDFQRQRDTDNIRNNSN